MLGAENGKKKCNQTMASNEVRMTMAANKQRLSHFTVSPTTFFLFRFGLFTIVHDRVLCAVEFVQVLASVVIHCDILQGIKKISSVSIPNALRLSSG